jgi:hypothetical protein
VKVLAPERFRDRTDRYNAFIHLGIPAAAGFADVYESQGQGLVDDPSEYASFTQRAAEQASGANPAVKNLGGLSTGPNGAEKAAQVLVDAAHESEASVAGWWINDPTSGGGECPGCSPVPHPETVVDFLQGL